MNTEQLLAKWLAEYHKTENYITKKANVVRVIRAQPRFQTRNYFARFKVETAILDGTGQNPSNRECFVLEISETSQTVFIDSSTSCDSIGDL